MRDPRVSQPFRSPLATHLGFERGFHRLNEIATHRLGQGVFANSGSETINMSASCPGHRIIYFDGNRRAGVISLREPINERFRASTCNEGRLPRAVLVEVTVHPEGKIGLDR